MNTFKQTSHVLEVQSRANSGWHPANDDVYRAAYRKADAGLLMDAINTAMDDHITKYGNMQV